MPLLLVAMHLLPYCSFNMLRTVCFLFPFHHQAGKTFGLLAWLHVHAVVRRGSAPCSPTSPKKDILYLNSMVMRAGGWKFQHMQTQPELGCD